jgi:two-component system cell cycle sensor histidine kinase/response regulator CckA
LNTVVAGMADLLARLIGEHIDLTFSPGVDLKHVQAEPGQIEQVLMNLAINAKDAMPEGGRLTISTRNVGREDASQPEFPAVEAREYVSLVVHDTGHGMSAETQARIYEPFFTTKNVGEGTGLGLFTVYGIVKQSKGHIFAESQPGRGTTFKVYLPCAARAGGEPETAALPRAPGGAETILLAEDEESIRELAYTFLVGLGYRVLLATDGIDAIQIAQAHKDGIDLLLTDAAMPKLGGNQLAQDLRKTFPGLKVIIMSGYAGDSTVCKGSGDSNTIFLQKPFSSLQYLAQKIRDVLDTAAIPSD